MNTSSIENESPNKSPIVALHVNRFFKAFSGITVVLGGFVAYSNWRADSIGLAAFFLFIAVYGLIVFFLADTKIYGFSDRILTVAPYGRYVMYWDEILSYDQKKSTTKFYGLGKAIGFDTRLATRTKKEFGEFVDQKIREHNIANKTPEGMTNSKYRKLFKGCYVGKGSLF